MKEIHFEDVIVFEGIYRNSLVQGRGTLVEMPIRSLRAQHDNSQEQQAISA